MDGDTLMRKKPIERRTGLKPRSAPIKFVSKKRAADRKTYSVLRREKLEQQPECELQYPGCTVVAVEVHHDEGRGINYLAIETFRSACRHCHDKVHDENYTDQHE